jgi:PIN domain nuclease of toxin-antitoxin system
MTSYILDTHVFLWLHTEPARLGDTRPLLQRASTALLLSPASSWEIAIKWSLGKLPLPEPPSTYVPERMRLARVAPMPIVHSHALAVAALPDHHRDPFDRMLVAQSISEGVPIVTADPMIREYDVEVLWLGT